MAHGIACNAYLDDPEHPCPGNSDDEVVAPPTHLCWACVPFTAKGHVHEGPHYCGCGFEWENDDQRL